MNAKDVKLGTVYLVKVSGKLVPVLVHSKSRFGGWDGRNQDTGRQVRIKTAARLRVNLSEEEAKQERARAQIAAILEAHQQSPAVDESDAAQVDAVAAAKLAEHEAMVDPSEPAKVEVQEAPAPAPSPETTTKRAWNRHPVPQANWQALALRFQAGETLKALADELGTTWQVVGRELGKVGVEFKTRKSHTATA